MSYQVLIVDDEEIVCRGLAQFVKWQNYGFAVAGTAYNADEALALLERTPVDVVFMDIRMPGKSGLELLQIIQKQYPHIKSVILSGYADFSYAQEAIRCGAVDYLTKPVVLKDIEALLERLRTEFLNCQRADQIRSNRVEALLLSAAKGYLPANSIKCDLPKLSYWYGLAMELADRSLTEEDIYRKKKQMAQQISALLPSAVCLPDEVFSMFCLLPCRTEADFSALISMMEHLDVGLSEWSCGASKQKYGLDSLHEGWLEAGRALRYHRAGSKEGIILYQNIETLFSQSALSLQDILPELLRRLTNPDTRTGVVPLLQEALASLLGQNLTVTQYQTACITFLIELNSYLQGLCLPDVGLHARLNEVLNALLLCHDYQTSADRMIKYVKWLTGLFDQTDEQSLGRDVIREIQMFIRQHYADNISLNSLAEQFYLHPNYLSRLFKEKTGQNFIDYLTEVRMEKVKELLKNSDRKIVEICDLTGYDNPRYFSKVFKQYTGMTPSEYRESSAAARVADTKDAAKY